MIMGCNRLYRYKHLLLNGKLAQKSINLIHLLSKYMDVRTLLFSLFTATCRDGDVRLMTGDTDESYYIKDELARGRVEVCVDERYGTVCDNLWDYEDASVTCAQLGFSPYGKSKIYMP